MWLTKPVRMNIDSIVLNFNRNIQYLFIILLTYIESVMFNSRKLKRKFLEALTYQFQIKSQNVKKFCTPNWIFDNQLKKTNKQILISVFKTSPNTNLEPYQKS